MVVTRRGVRVSSPTKSEPDRSSDVQATPSTGLRARRTAKEADTPAQHAVVEINGELHKTKGGPTASVETSLMKICTSASRVHSPEQPSTPVGSTHEADMSDLESCCSVVSDIEPLVTRIKGRRKQPCTVGQEEAISEVESCSSASKTGLSSRRSTRKKTLPESSDLDHLEQEHMTVDQVLNTKSSSSLASGGRRVTRSQRKSACTISTAKQQSEDSEVSDGDSCMSSVLAAWSTTRRATRSTRQTCSIPFHLDETSESSQSPAQTGRRTRAARRKPAVDASEPLSCDSEGFESGPTYSMATRSRAKTRSTGPKATDSESELTDVHSPFGSFCSVQVIVTPCSSRTGSGSSRHSAPASRCSVKDLSRVVENVGEPTEEDSSLNDSRLESTVIAEEADCTLLEEQKRETVIPEGDSHFSLSVSDIAGCAEAAALTPKDQREELFTENKDGDTSEMEIMQERISSSELLKPCESVTVVVDDKASDITDEKDEAVDVTDVDPSSVPRNKAVDEDAVAEHQCIVVEKMEVSTLKTDDQQEVESSDVQVESILVTSRQQHKITVDSHSEKQSTDVIVQTAKVISLLESSDDEDDYGEAEEMHGSEEEERGRQSKKWESAASVDGLFMIDTRPGEDADEHYYKERPTEQEEKAPNKDEQEDEDEEFLDEAGADDDDDDDDAEILFSSRDPHSKELSSRIDPGIRVKALGGLYINFDGSKSKPVSGSLLKPKEKKIQDELMKKSVIGPDFEKKDAVPPYSESKRAVKLKHREERAKSTGDGWFNMKAPEVSQDLKRDLQVLKMRGSMDPKRFYKKNDRDGFPKYFQVGTVVDSAVDFHSRILKKERKRTMVEELLADAEFRHNNKKKFQHILMEKAAQGVGKRNKKKNKFHKK